MIDEKYENSELTGKVIGAAMEVHRTLGNGFQEVIYQRALAVELDLLGVKYEREKEMHLFYKEHNIGTRRVDFFIENEIMVELKAITALEAVHLAQAKNYLEAYNIKLGLLINFGAPSLQFKRIINKYLK
ncbi:GxxExxY protein [Parabacteroides sp. PFB2-12]|uniref:GxxExxY protein n=1 Tax=unclassified Parabacteroides TaxID=2649774 RepID=UPI002473FA01|nr:MULTISPECIES: GxxExxY protein [unclassified Parabacteroides]MDH6341598.1 GxxExxY protein [Parabacteroides sp. PM6-13]MDH6389979.1 GxxExxY protein [Parabacteroides sp. PFB2-12]